MSGDGEAGPAAGPDVGARLAQYADLWRSAGTKLAAADYHADDLVTDWFRWVGLAARDTTAVVAVALRAARPGDEG